MQVIRSYVGLSLVNCTLVRIQSGGSTCGRLLSKIYSSEANTLDASASARDDIHAQFITYKVRSDQI